MKRLPVIVAAIALAGSLFAQDELSLARAALRDSLWEIARSHAAKAGGEDARMVALESLAREGKLAAIPEFLRPLGGDESEGERYYHALALLRTGESAGARRHLAAVTAYSAPLADEVARLVAESCLAEGNHAAALQALAGSAADDPDTMMIAARAYAEQGDAAAADRLWRRVAAATNACDEAVAAAGINLRESDTLRFVIERTASPRLRLACQLNLAVLLLEDEASFEEGARMVREAARQAPDARLSRPAALLLADAYLTRGDYPAAAAAYADILEIWPDAARDVAVQEGRALAFERTGRLEEALKAYELAEQAATNDADRALARVKAGDLLSSAGRLEPAMTAYRAVLERYPETPVARRIASIVELRELEARGRQAFDAYRFAEAQRIFAEIGEREAQSRARMGLYVAICLYAQGYDELAEKKARAVAEGAEPAVRAEARLWLAKFYYNHSRWREAEQLFVDYADASAKAPAATEALVWAARSAFAHGDYVAAVQLATRVVEADADGAASAEALVLQGEALIEQARFDEAVLVLERAALAAGTDSPARKRALLLKADALFAMGADAPRRYQEAFEAYRGLHLAAGLSPSETLTVAYKIARTLERLKRMDEAIDQYYTQVVLAYGKGREAGTEYDEDARAAFSRAAFRLAENFESRGQDRQALGILHLVEQSDVPASAEARRSIERIQGKGRFL